ncbi:polysaccharide deacetylase [bacterium]|nr:MAG: polysaccharide deacetylase [bacterium]
MMQATLSLDLDNQWSYMKTHGDAGWEAFPSYLDVVVPRVLAFLAQRSLRITVFVVGQDAELPRNMPMLRSVAEAGHEIGNHSFHHEPWLHLHGEAEIDGELARAESAIERATGVHPFGFRGPGFTRSETILRVLARRGYRYDASTLATWIGPLARAYYFRTAHLDAQAMREREALFGRLTDAFQPNGCRWVRTTAGEIAVLPVTTMPLLRVPIHVSYVLYLAAVSPAAARAYFRAALTLCRLTGTEPSILLHPLDFLGAEDCPELAFFPAMQMGAKAKIAVVSQACEALSSAFDIRPLLEYVREREAPSSAMQADRCPRGSGSPSCADRHP